MVFLCGLAFAAGPPGLWLDVPFVKQETNGCGAASVAMVMQYWLLKQERAFGDNADVTTIQRALYSPQAHGIYASDLERYLRENGFRTFAFRGEWKDFRTHLQRGRPLVAALKPVGVGAPLHYVVVVGLDWEQQLVMLNDPAQRKLLKQEWSSFEREWKAAGNWTLLAVPQQVATGSLP
ncbi:MAG: C39 family peptidase [Terriglobales bacterium]